MKNQAMVYSNKKKMKRAKISKKLETAMSYMLLQERAKKPSNATRNYGFGSRINMGKPAKVLIPVDLFSASYGMLKQLDWEQHHELVGTNCVSHLGAHLPVSTPL